ncbi:MAG: TonB-dependent receptor domain-containing protein [Bryobacteraceae bacterium]
MSAKLTITLLALSSFTFALRAQTGVVQSGGQPIPGATVTATQGGRKITTTTDDNGRYEITGLAPGAYTVDISIFGFKASQRQFDQSASSASAEWTLELQPRVAAGPRPALLPGARPGAVTGAQPNQIDAQIDAAMQNPTPAQPPATGSDSGNESFLVSGSLSQGLQTNQNDLNPQQGPDMGGMRQGMGQRGPGGFGPGGPGVGPGGPAGAPSFGGPDGGRGGFGQRGGGGFQQRGDRRNNRNAPGGAGAFIGNRRNRGREGLHGMAFLSLRNSALDARPFSFTGEDTRKAAYAQARMGVVLGGPLRIPKILKGDQTSFFVNFFLTRAKNPYQGVATVPTLLERAGDFSQSLNGTGGLVTLYDPTTGLPIPGNRLPAGSLNNAAFGLLNFIPLPNHPGQVQNYQILSAYPQNSANLSVRLNQNITKRDRLAFNVGIQDRSGQNEQLFGFRDETSGFGANAEITYTHNLGQRSINVLRFNFNRNRSTTTPFFAYKTDVATALGIRGTAADPINFGPPNLSFTNFGALADSSAVLNRIQSSGISETVSTVKAQHNISAGMNFTRSQLNLRTDSNARGSFSFSGVETSAFDANGFPITGTGFDFADFLLGRAQSSSVRFGTSSNYFRGNVWGAFVQDDWRARANLTINAGLRYEYYSPLSEKYGHLANLDLAPGFTAASVVIPGQNAPYSGSLPASLLHPDKNNFAPRVGLAWKPRPGKQLQVRASYGIYYNTTVYNQIASRLASQPPFADTETLTTSLADPLTLQNGLAATRSGKLILNTFAVDPDYRVGYAQTWNTAVQNQFAHGIVVEVGYLGTKGTRLDIQGLPNRAPPGSPLTAEQRRQIGNAVGFTYENSNGDSIYHAMQVRLIRRFQKGMSFQAFYTFAKSIDNSSTFGGAGNTVAQDNNDLRAERGLSSFDQRHTLNLNWMLSMPKLENQFAKNWTLNGGMTYGSGTPLTARVLGNQADTAGTGSVGSGRAEATGVSVTGGNGFFNPSAYVIPLPGQFGNAGRNTIPGPSTWALNAGLSRTFSLGERRRLEFRLDANNLTNHVNFTNLDTIVNASNYGLPLAAGPMRSLTANFRFRF